MTTLSVTLPSFGPIFRDNNFHQIADLAKMAEQAGVDRIMLTDHVVMGKHTDKYPYGPFPFPPETAWLEPLASIAHMAAVTERVRFSTKILIAPLRPAAVLAKTLATMDVLSQGRLEVGVGTGWQREEYEAAGVPWNQRADVSPTLSPPARRCGGIPQPRSARPRSISTTSGASPNQHSPAAYPSGWPARSTPTT